MLSNDASSLPQDVNTYDVLLRKHKNNHVEIMSFGNHIGNRRFQILLEIHRLSYNTAMQENDTSKCDRILHSIAHTICHNCIPNGRFFEQDLNSLNEDQELKWNNLGDGALVRERIRRGFLGLLYTVPDEKRVLPLHVPVEYQKKKVNVNLKDNRFAVKGLPSRASSECTDLRIRLRLRERTTSDPEFPTYERRHAPMSQFEDEKNAFKKSDDHLLSRTNHNFQKRSILLLDALHEDCRREKRSRAA